MATAARANAGALGPLPVALVTVTGWMPFAPASSRVVGAEVQP